MADPFDIFEVFAQDSVRWIGTAASLTDAEAAIQRATSDSTGAYLILNQRTGRKVVFNRDSEGLMAAGFASGDTKTEVAAA
jgi:hypothetical protein